MRPLLLALLTVSICACAPTLSPGAPCAFNSDCDAPLLCRNARCRIACIEARDCGPGLRCVQSADGPSCTLEREESCDAANPCPGALRCVFGQCRSECVSDDDCSRDGVCDEDGSCLEVQSGVDGGVMRMDAGPPADAPACTPMPMMCENGIAERCDLGLEGAVRALTGATTGTITGELSPIDPLVIDDIERPREGTALPPEIALGLSADDGYGVVGYLADGPARNAHFVRFSLADPRIFETVDTGITNARTLVLGEHGVSVVGLVLLTEPLEAGLSAHNVSFLAEGAATVGTLRSGDPIGVPSGEMTIVGGERSIGPSGSALFYIARENKTPTDPPGPTEPTIGAIDEGIGFDTYRASFTTSLDEAQDYLRMGGSAGSVVIVHEPETAVYGLWNVAQTPALMNPGGVPSDHVRPFGGFAANIGGPAIVQTGTDGGYVLAIPTANVDGRGMTRLFTVSCVDDQACGTPAGLRDLETRTDRRPEMVRLAPLLGGHAMASLEPDSSGLNAAYLYLLDPNWVDVTGDDAPIVPIPTTTGEQVVAIQMGSVSDGVTATLIVAVLIRNESRTADRIWVGGYRACITR